MAGAGLIVGTPLLASARGWSIENDPLPPEKVKEFVIAGHGNFDQVKKMLADMPTLLYATWDWGSGDFETALEGAGHVGNKEIANYLIGTGARTNLFVLEIMSTWFNPRAARYEEPLVVARAAKKPSSSPQREDE